MVGIRFTHRTDLVVVPFSVLLFSLYFPPSVFRLPSSVFRLVARYASCHQRFMEKPWDLRERTLAYAVDVIKFCRTLPKSDEAREIAGQVRRSSSSIGAHYVAAQRNKSDDDYISKTGGAIEEADESTFWFDVLIGAEIAAEAVTAPLRQEADELAKILVKCRSTAIERRERLKAQKRKKKAE